LAKWDALRLKIDESACSVICVQETKRQAFDLKYIWQFAPRRFDAFDYIPSVGASGGLLVAWNISVFQGSVVQKCSYSITVQFSSTQNMTPWCLTSVYGPCQEPHRTEFINWFKPVF